MVWTEVRSDPLCEAVFQSGGFCLSCRLIGGTKGDYSSRGGWRVALPDRQAARSLVEAAHALDSTVQVDILGPPSAPVSPTMRERQAIDVAKRLGYFSQPRRADLAIVARELSISRQAASALIRRGLARLSDYIGM